MNRKVLAGVLAVLVLLAAVTVVGSFLNGLEPSDMWTLCASGAAGAAEDFREFAGTGDQRAYWSGVAEFRSFMKAYLFLCDGETGAEYIWCNSVYGVLLLGPDRAGAQAEVLAQAMELLARDPEDINGFAAISRVNNALIHGE